MRNFYVLIIWHCGERNNLHRNSNFQSTKGQLFKHKDLHLNINISQFQWKLFYICLFKGRRIHIHDSNIWENECLHVGRIET